MEYEGLSSKEAALRLAANGLNAIPEEKRSFVMLVLSKFTSPVTALLIVAAGISLSVHELFDFYFILVLIVLNIGINIWHEWKADNAIEQLKAELLISVRVFRDREWKKIGAPELVCGDVIRLNVGDVVPADASVIEARHASLNEAALTGESLPQDKEKGSTVYTGTYLTSGYVIAKVTATGAQTRLGETIETVEKAKKRSVLEEDIIRTTKYLSIASFCVIAVLVAFFMFRGEALSDILLLALSVLLAGIPISLPTVMTLIISIGVLALAKERVIVRKISSLENLANVDLLLTDKTGTLTEDALSLVRVVTYGGASVETAVRYAAAANEKDEGAITHSIIEYMNIHKIAEDGLAVLDFIPHDSDRKHSTTTVREKEKTVTIAFGAPQVIKEFVSFTNGAAERQFDVDVNAYAVGQGYRGIALAAADGTEEKNMRLIAIFFFSDTLRSDAKQTIDFMRDHGIETKILTGDNHEISNRVAHELGLSGKVLSRKDLEALDPGTLSESAFKEVSVFSEILPIQKYRIVEYAKKKWMIAVTGDGVNDIPPIEAADAGIAVSSAVSSLKGAADIVLTKPGIAVVKEALLQARAIFERAQIYAVYRTSESIRVIVAILVLALTFKSFPILPIQLLILALMNDIPIISLAFDRVKPSPYPPRAELKEKYLLGFLFGGVGVVTSVLFVFVMRDYFHLSWAIIQTLFFLKLSVGGHMLIYVAHTKKRWYRFLPSKEVIFATTTTQFIATLFAFFGFLMAAADWKLIIFTWIWSFFFMQISELMKDVHQVLTERFLHGGKKPTPLPSSAPAA